MISCFIRIPEDPIKLRSLFLPEGLGKAVCKVKEKGGAAEIEVAAEDITSLKGSINSVLKILETYQKINNLKWK